MTIREIELFHGVVFTKLLRSDRPLNLKLFEFNSDKSSAAYIVNDEVALYVKHSKSPKPRERKGFEQVWHFNFSPKHLEEIRNFSMDRTVRMVLVCGDNNLNNSENMQVCFLEPEEISICINEVSNKTQTISVADVKRGKLRVWGSRSTSKDPKLIEKKRLELWNVPGN